ncbi:putative peroxidase [Rosa chinensis]|uniref:peroxidase n=1 Tax=Rosa chinensis TaxID=74649 RepID=A0A2P6PWC7_ROSCH|nr:putative peroxidase [Rosa chinensis]
MLVFVALYGILGDCQGGQRRTNFYKKTCLAEEIVRNVTWNHVTTNQILPAKLLRLHFHDCFVRVLELSCAYFYTMIQTVEINLQCVHDFQGCDGSVLLNSIANNTADRRRMCFRCY